MLFMTNDKLQMEMTEIQWNVSFGCEKRVARKKDLRLSGAIAGMFIILIVVFYGGANLYGHVEEKREKTIYSGKTVRYC